MSLPEEMTGFDNKRISKADFSDKYCALPFYCSHSIIYSYMVHDNHERVLGTFKLILFEVTSMELLCGFINKNYKSVSV